MKKFIIAVLVVFGFASSSNADIIFSTSATDATAGASLDLDLNSNGNLFVWVSTAADQRIRGLAIDIDSDNVGILSANSHVVENPSSRWLAAGSGILGDSTTGKLVDDSNSFFAFGVNGISSTDYVLHSTLNVEATAAGSTILNLGVGEQLISLDGGGNLGAEFFGNSATVTVSSAVPEPGSLLALTVLGGGLALIRRRK